MFPFAYTVVVNVKMLALFGVRPGRVNITHTPAVSHTTEMKLSFLLTNK